MTLVRRDLMADMAVTVPPQKSGDLEISRFEVDNKDFWSAKYAMEGRGCLNGTYTRLDKGGTLWMSDTTAERKDHYEAARKIDHYGGRILIGGLGLGMILQVALLTPTVTHVDVLEFDADIIRLVGPHYRMMALERGIKLDIHHESVFTATWAKGTRWSVAWFDVWEELSTDNLVEMASLRRSYSRRTDWCECWGREGLLRRRRQEQSSPWSW